MRLLSILAALACTPGCAFFAQSHLPYTPMLNRGGQADVSLRTGVTYPGGAAVAANAAIAPVDGFEVLANADFNLGTSNSHYGGGLAIGTFVPTDTFRLEFIAGANAGYGEGTATEIGSPRSFVFDVTGPYVVPFGQLMLGFETQRFLFAAGARVQGFFSEVIAVESAGESRPAFGYERLYVEPIVTVQFPIDFVRIEVTTGFPIYVQGDAGPTSASIDSTLQWYLAAGVGFQWDAFGEGEPEPEPEYVAPGAYTPTYAAPPPAPAPAPAEPTPAAPSTYGAPPPTATEPPPAPTTEPTPTEPTPTEPSIMTPLPPQ